MKTPLQVEQDRAEEFDVRFGKGHKDFLKPTVAEIVRDVHRAFSTETLRLYKEAVAGMIEGIKPNEYAVRKYKTLESPTWDTLKWKDVLVGNGGERMVLGVLNDCVLMSTSDDHKSTGSWYTKEELQSYGYTIKSSTITIEGKAEVEELLKGVKEVGI